MTKILVAVRRLSDSHIIALFASSATLIAVIVFSLLPTFPAVRGSQPLPMDTPLLYQITIFIPFGMVLAEFFLELRRSFKQVVIKIGTVLVIIGSLSLSRLLFFIPVSGHCLLLGYFIPRQLVTHRLKFPIRTVVGFLVLGQILYYKFWVWSDPVTPFTGLGLGLLVWLLGDVLLPRLAATLGWGIAEPKDESRTAVAP